MEANLGGNLKVVAVAIYVLVDGVVLLVGRV